MQGVSTAGLQEGLEDSRTSLVSEPFRVYDELDDDAAFEAEFLRVAVFGLLFDLQEFEVGQYCLDSLCRGRDCF